MTEVYFCFFCIFSMHCFPGIFARTINWAVCHAGDSIFLKQPSILAGRFWQLWLVLADGVEPYKAFKMVQKNAIYCQSFYWNPLVYCNVYFFSVYRAHTIINCGLYTFYLILEDHFFSRRIFQKILYLCMVSILKRFLIKSG